MLLEAARQFKLERYHQVSTDEVYGAVLEGARVETDPPAHAQPLFRQQGGRRPDVPGLLHQLQPAGDHHARRNNIGPYQYPEKVVPLFITNAIDDMPLPLYGDGSQMRDYQYVLDHCDGH